MSKATYHKIALLCLSFAAFIVSISASSSVYAGERELVLVTGKTSAEFSLNRKEVRLLFMGLPILKNEQRIIPLINASNSLTYEVFLQKIIHMSAKIYERRLTAKVFRLGSRKPIKYYNQKKIITELKTNKNTVSFMWKASLRNNTSVKIIGNLWSGNIE